MESLQLEFLSKYETIDMDSCTTYRVLFCYFLNDWYIDILVIVVQDSYWMTSLQSLIDLNQSRISVRREDGTRLGCGYL